MRRVFVDTGVWYALVDADDPDHARAERAVRAYRGRLATSNFVIDETLTLARYRLGWPVAQRLGKALFAGQLARVERVAPKDELAAWSIFEGCTDKRFSFTDCTSFALVERLGLTLCLAIDADFRSYGLACEPMID